MRADEIAFVLPINVIVSLIYLGLRNTCCVLCECCASGVLVGALQTYDTHKIFEGAT